MRRKIEQSKDSLVIKLPTECLNALGLDEGDEVFISLDQANERIIISPTGSRLAYEGVDEEFAKQVADFIERYKPALEELARE